MDGVNDQLLHWARSQGIDAVPLFDLSGGAGILPEQWPEPIEGVYCGYAGGLSPENVAEQLEKIEAVTPNARIWIDAETHVRSNGDQLFDLEKVRRFLEVTRPWVEK
jgi:phosphoribosylanthranilate isomerase